MDFDYDYLVIGSGFGGSVSALRLAEKGWRVGVVEQGRRIGPQEIRKGICGLSGLFSALISQCGGSTTVTAES